MYRIFVYLLIITLFYCSIIAAQEDSCIDLMVRAGQAIESVKNSTVKQSLQKELEKILDIQDEQAKLVKLQKFVFALEKTVNNKNVQTEKELTSPKNTQIQLDKEIELCNLLTKYACILYDLDGRGFLLVRKELLDNINTAQLSKESNSLLRRLILICDEAEKTFRGISYIRQDDSEAKAEVFGYNIGYSSAQSIALGNPLPLLQGAINIISGVDKLDKQKNRQLDVIIQGYKSYLNNFLFEINTRRSDLSQEYGVTPSQFLTKEVYERFRNALLEDDNNKKLSILQSILSSSNNFREVSYYIALAHLNLGDVKSSIEVLIKLVTTKNIVIQRDGLLCPIYTLLSLSYFFNKEYELAISSADDALKIDNSDSDGILRKIKIDSLWKLGKWEKTKSMLLELAEQFPNDSGNSYNLACYCSLSKDAKNSLAFLEIALKQGYNHIFHLRKDNDLNFLKSEKNKEFESLISVSFKWGINYGVFNDDIWCKNTSIFKITNVIFKGCINKKDFDLFVVAIDPGETYTWTNAVSVPSSSTTGEATLSCDQNSSECPRCLGKKHIDESDIARLRKQGDWTPGPCKYCKE